MLLRLSGILSGLKFVKKKPSFVDVFAGVVSVNYCQLHFEEFPSHRAFKNKYANCASVCSQTGMVPV
jgi:hypothetical protein